MTSEMLWRVPQQQIERCNEAARLEHFSLLLSQTFCTSSQKNLLGKKVLIPNMNQNFESWKFRHGQLVSAGNLSVNRLISIRHFDSIHAFQNQKK